MNKKCPHCGSSKTAPILYGYPILNEETKQALDEKKLYLGGCCVCGIEPEFHCFDCKKDFGTPPVFVCKNETEKYRDMLMEAVASTNEDLMMKYFEGEEITHMEAVNAVHEGIIHGDIVPVFCGAATKLWGVWSMLDKITESFPRHTAKKQETLEDGGKMDITPEGEPAIFVFKTVADPFVGKMSFFKVMNGSVRRDMTLRNNTSVYYY